MNTSAFDRDGCPIVFCCIRIDIAASCGLDGGFIPNCGRLGGLLPDARGPDCGPDEDVLTGCVLERWIDGSEGTLGLEPGCAPAICG